MPVERKRQKRKDLKKVLKKEVLLIKVFSFLRQNTIKSSRFYSNKSDSRKNIARWNLDFKQNLIGGEEEIILNLFKYN